MGPRRVSFPTEALAQHFELAPLAMDVRRLPPSSSFLFRCYKALFFIFERPLSLHRARPWDHHGRAKAMVPRETVSTDNDRHGYSS
jgi:hypothetical protein